MTYILNKIMALSCSLEICKNLKTLAFSVITAILLFSCKNTSNQDSEEKTAVDSIATIQRPTESTPGDMKNIYVGCGYNKDLLMDEMKLNLPETRALEQIKSILSHTGIPMNFEFYSANILNACATIIEDERFILYDPRLFQYADILSDDYWSSMSILAHEIGHHLSGHTLKFTRANQHQKELEADKFSGFVLYKMGATLQQAKAAINNLGTDVDTDSHPSKYKRFEAIEEGWNEANNQRFNSALPPPPNDNEAGFYEFTKEMLINKEYLEHEWASSWYSNPSYFYGIIKDVDPDYSSFRLHVVKSETSNENNEINFKNQVVDIATDEIGYGGNSEMCHSCANNFKGLIVPGRRIKVSFVEAFPGAGTAYNGVFYLTYAKALKSDSF